MMMKEKKKEKVKEEKKKRMLKFIYLLFNVLMKKAKVINKE